MASEGDTLSKRDVFRIALQTRNLEISLFWQRSNYFLVLNTAIAVGLFSTLFAFANDSKLIGLALSGFGIGVSLLWLCINTGSKFWQVRWESRLSKAEKDISEHLDLFYNECPDRLRNDVECNLGHHKWALPWCFIGLTWDKLVLRKFSVSGLMTLLSFLFICFWITLVVLVSVGLIPEAQNTMPEVRSGN